ncbi:MAG TPA: hypothetical protein VIH93_09010 [Thermoanaerobaculia bacterium]
MSTVQELSVLHRRYADISHRFRAAWTFHQFLQSLGKSVLGHAPDLANDFQSLYTDLKEISQSLNSSETERLRPRLDQLDRRLGELIWTLEEEDSRVDPHALRQFFLRIKSYDEKILVQLVKFYVYAQHGEGWLAARIDKADYLLTRLSEDDGANTGDAASGPSLRDARRLSEIYQALWALLGADNPSPELIAERRGAIEQVRIEVGGIENLEQLNESGLIARYRDIKHGLNHLFFEPELALAIQEANLAIRARIQKLYGQEERRIVSEYQRVFELEREVPVSGELDGELTQFREEVERFERQLQSDEFKLQDIAQIRQRVRDLMPRLSEARALTPFAPRLGDTGDALAAAAAEAPLAEQEDVLGEHFRQLLAALREANPDLGPESVVLTPGIFPYRLEVREVVAFRRLYGDDECDRELEQFLLEAAALRVKLNEEAQEIAGILDETSVTGESQVFGRARMTARFADSYLWRFHHVLNEMVLTGDAAEARLLQLLRMRLMRDYSGLWLLAYKPVFSRRRTGATFA